ncbi:MAG: hypothetical protein HC769_07500 [Cyanobacteria bacterium CRU_2_1]|nr:hypothetical protein [Cyanobacteria bacterium CRU_2_1]
MHLKELEPEKVILPPLRGGKITFSGFGAGCQNFHISSDSLRVNRKIVIAPQELDS